MIMIINSPCLYDCTFDVFWLTIYNKLTPTPIIFELSGDVVTHSQLLKGPKCGPQVENNVRRKSRGTLLSSQHFEG